jgi:hypothetical protein
MDWETNFGSDQNFKGQPRGQGGLPERQAMQFRGNSELEASERT